MKIVRLSKDSNLNRIAKVFKWNRFSGRGPVGSFPIINTLDNQATILGADVAILEASGDDWAQKKWTFDNLLVFIFNRVATFLNYEGLQTNIINFPAVGNTVTVDVTAASDYTIQPAGSGGSFTLDIGNIPAAPKAWSATIYAINWDGVTVTLPANSQTPGGTGLSFTSGGGADRLVVRGNTGPSGNKEFYNLPGNML